MKRLATGDKFPLVLSLGTFGLEVYQRYAERQWVVMGLSRFLEWRERQKGKEAGDASV